jgi:CheY-like chemotaxis protein
MARILVVDDSDFVRIFCRDALEDGGHEVDDAANGTDGIAMFEAGKYDCVLLDVLMPDIDGLEVLKEIRKVDQDVPVLLMTGDDPGWARRSYEQYGATAFLSKALGADKLIDKVEEVILDAET